MDSTGTVLSTIVLALAIGFLVFLILRAFFCWYAKINERIKLMEKQNEYLLKLCKYEKYRMVKDGFINAGTDNFTEFDIDDNLNFKIKNDAENTVNN